MRGIKRSSIKEGLFAGLERGEDEIRLAGSRCAGCGEVFLGKRKVCENCSAQAMEAVAFSREGVLWSYTVVRYAPPPGYKVPGPFAPYAVGLVELPEGIRIMSPIDCDPARVRIGMKLKSVVYPLYEEEGREVMAFKFAPA